MKTKNETMEENAEELEVLEVEGLAEPEILQDPILAHNRRLARITFYTAAVSVLVIMLFAWIVSYYSVVLLTQVNNKAAETMQQLNGRMAKLEASIRPAPAAPTFVTFTPPQGAPRQGSADAKVTMVEFADFQCPYCGKFQSEVYPQIKANYIDTGKVAFVYQDFAFLGTESTQAAEAARCAADQQKFWEYHDYLFTHQNGENRGTFAVKNLKAFARTLRLDPILFNLCLDIGKYKSDVATETASGKTIGVTGTPAFVINGKFVVGALPYENFKQTIDEALAK